MESSHGLQPRVQNRDGGKKDIWKLSDWRLTPLLINCREMRFTSLMWCVIIFQPSKQSLQHLQCPNPSQRLLAASVAWFCGTFNSYHSFCRQKRLQMLDSGFFFKQAAGGTPGPVASMARMQSLFQDLCRWTDSTWKSICRFSSTDASCPTDSSSNY